MPAQQPDGEHADFPGLEPAEAARLLRVHGPNALPQPRQPSLAAVFLRQFLSPLIYVLLAAALVSVALGDVRDAAFIGVVLLVNGVIGTVQEYSAGRATAALRRLEQPRATVVRAGERYEIDARELVPGDVVMIEAGGRVPADLRLLESQDLQCDESLLTGEALPVAKAVSEASAPAYAGTLVTRGRATGLVTATGRETEIGRIAGLLAGPSDSPPPLMIRLEAFSRAVAVSVGIAVVVLMLVGLARNMGFHELFLMAVGLAVSAIPEGLPIAISVALAIGMRRMAKVNVIVRNMPAIEALGSCTLIATDKTGTLTMNELTVTEVRLPDGLAVLFEAGPDVEACRVYSPDAAPGDARARSARLLRAAAMPNEGALLHGANGWAGVGDTVDVALLFAARKAGIVHEEAKAENPLVARIPYEPDLKYAASFHANGKSIRVFVKGAPETLIAMCDRMEIAGRPAPIDRAALLAQKEELAARGLRVLAFAEGEIGIEKSRRYGRRHLLNLDFLGLAGMQDPLRPEVPKAISACRQAGIEIVMVTGDDPRTASAIARQAGIGFTEAQVVTGEQVTEAEAAGEAALDALTRSARIYARVKPVQKLAIVRSLQRNGHFVAVTGDGVNDAPALKHAHVGVAMGRKGTDVAKESADIIVTDDNFASIVAGIRAGRVAYANIRKVVFMLVSTGAAEVLLFLLALPFGLPMPLLPVQLLWLNLVTNGIQDVFLAGERPEGDELSYPPRNPREPIFDRPMLRRILISTLVMGGGAFALFWWLLERGHSEFEARNLLLLLFVLFENLQTLNSRSEHHSAFRQGFFGNPLLIIGIVGAQAVHVLAMHIPLLRETLSLAPVTWREWAMLLAAGTVLLAAMELDKWRARRAAAAAGLRN